MTEEEEFQQRADKLRQEVDEMKEAFAELERAMKGMNKYVRPTADELLNKGHKWQKWYAWRPVKDIHGQWHCFKEVYHLPGNTYVDREDWSWYYYGTVFDVLKS